MMRFLLTAMFLFIPLSSPLAQDISGFWLTENERAVIEINPCDRGLCGSIYWIIEGGMQFDEKNPDPARRQDPMCGLEIMWGFNQERSGAWENGRIYKADDGDTYKAKMRMQDDGTLKLRGYVGFSLFGSSQVWTRADADDYEQCTPAVAG